MKVKHENTGSCQKCAEILNAHGGTYTDLHLWFLSQQLLYPQLHVSCSVRGMAAQETAKLKGFSKASFGQSSHNYAPSAAIDTFFLIDGKCEWPAYIYKEICGEYGELLPDSLSWLGRKGSPFPELPHFEVREWKELVRSGELKLTDEE